jgi:hypothetical protein
MDSDAFKPNLPFSRTYDAMGNSYREVIIVLASFIMINYVELAMRVSRPYVPYLINIIAPFESITTKL